MLLRSISIYLHIPFCVRKCPYCDFNSHVSTPLPEKDYLNALTLELSHYAELASWSGRTCDSIFFGGGTPSLFAPDSLGRIIEHIGDYFPLSPSAEISLEANPGTLNEKLDFSLLESFRSSGINRISLGAQSFCDEKLKFLGRIHSAGDINCAYENILKAGFTNTSLDILFGICDETVKDWERDLLRALELQPKHISAYALTVEGNSAFAVREKAGERFSADEKDIAAMYSLTQEILEDNNFQQYEISNYSQDGFECLHNLNYWKGADYLGLGAGAHSYLNTSHAKGSSFGMRWSNVTEPNSYMDSVAKCGQAKAFSEQLSQDQAELEFLFLRLRMLKGFSHAEYRGLFNKDFSEHYAETLKQLKRERLITSSNQRTSLTKKGVLFSDSVFGLLACQ